MYHVRGNGEVHLGFWWGSLRERGQLEDPGVDWRIILRYLKEVRSGGIDWIDVAGSLKCGNDPSGSIKCGEFLG
jgi:hypothetical protein